VDSSVPARDAGPLVRGRTGRSRGCCAVAGDDTGDPHGWLTALAFLLAGSLRWRRRRS
jgi:MYXO-CTERM domain-containing protein